MQQVLAPFRLLPLAVPLVVALLSASPGTAQQFTGTWAVADDAGGIMTLVLQQSGGERVTGTLTASGDRYQVEGIQEDGIVTGSMRSSSGLLHFEAERWEDELWVMLYGSDVDGYPDYDDVTEIDFVLQSPDPRYGAGGVRSLSAGGPLGGNPLGSVAGAADPYVGTFSDGNVLLELEGAGGRYQGRVHVGGAVYPVQAQGGLGGIRGLIQAPDGAYQLSAQAQGGGLIVVSGGMRYDLIRQSAPVGAQGYAAGGPPAPTGPQVGARPGGTGRPGAPEAGRPGARPDASRIGIGGASRTSTGRELAPGFTEDHPMVAEWIAFLSGKKLTTMSSYSSGSAGGYSARTDVYLCSDRSYAVRDESSVSVDVGGAFGSSGGIGASEGNWYVITNGQVVGLVLEDAAGQALEVRMDYQGQQTFANGERVYVTPAELCR